MLASDSAARNRLVPDLKGKNSLDAPSRGSLLTKSLQKRFMVGRSTSLLKVDRYSYLRHHSPGPTTGLPQPHLARCLLQGEGSVSHCLDPVVFSIMGCKLSILNKRIMNTSEVNLCSWGISTVHINSGMPLTSQSRTNRERKVDVCKLWCRGAVLYMTCALAEFGNKGSVQGGLCNE